MQQAGSRDPVISPSVNRACPTYYPQSKQTSQETTGCCAICTTEEQMQEGKLPEYILLMCEDFLYHQSNCYILQLVFALQRAPCKAPKRRLFMVGWNSTLVWWETTVFVITMIQIKCRLLSRIPLPSLARGGLGREGSHTQIPPLCIDMLASWQGVYNNWLGTAASQLRENQWNSFRNASALL